MSTSPISTLSPPAYDFERALREGGSNNILGGSDTLSKIICEGRNIEKQMYYLSLDGIEMINNEQDDLFTMYSIDTVHSSYLAAKSRVRQYTQFVVLLKRSEEAWAQKLQETGYAVMNQNLYRMGIESEDDEDLLLKCTVDTVSAHYIAAQHRVRQYTQFLRIMMCEEEAWAERFQEASCVMPDYKPARCQCWST
ncbi:hypothetical protein CY34DRAFT_104073 [Suillus luteus UH-Slu-Lm8-n1]|uniref:Uncharacterized protein n=1 Tax=Suillus luteus UH-Slu-Lm8-n1 TaxID=930992 RepID=A0A0D0BEM7_9AGAM|nr:hypothetical protein CY34DRAFT_104073 [Suillus luteus UH-Slu-Lm8-n1]